MLSPMIVKKVPEAEAEPDMPPLFAAFRDFQVIEIKRRAEQGSQQLQGEVLELALEEGLRRAFEQGFAPIARRLGWRPEFRWGRLAQWAAGQPDVRLLERRPMPPLGHFSLIRFARVARQAPSRRTTRASTAGGLSRPTARLCRDGPFNLPP